METAAHILATLVCTKCDQLLKRGPVYQQHDGAAVCGVCQARKDAQPTSRCLLYEATAELVRFPCRYKEEGCRTTVPFVAAGCTEFNHEDACEYRLYVCPVLGSNCCDWAGRCDQLLQHCQEQHPNHVLPNPVLITPDIRHSQATNYIIPAFRSLFLLHTRVSLPTAKLHYAMRLLGNPQLASNFSFTVNVRRGETIFTRSMDVLPQEVLALQEHSALNLSTNSLLSMLGGWDDASLSVEVKARWPQEDLGQVLQHRKAGQKQEQCGRCQADTLRLYQDGRGWLCLKCAPQKWTCHNEGCDFQDLGWGKKEKHSDWFCQRRTNCFVCNTVLKSDTSCQQHYKTCTEVKVVPAGSTFLVRCVNSWQHFLVNTASGHVLCVCYYSTLLNFSLWVRAPVPCEQLHLHRCQVQFECASYTRTHTPDTKYDEAYDWEVQGENDNFFTCTEVYVSLQVNKME